MYALNLSVPPPTTVGPEYEFAAPEYRTPVPNFVKPPLLLESSDELKIVFPLVLMAIGLVEFLMRAPKFWVLPLAYKSVPPVKVTFPEPNAPFTKLTVPLAIVVPPPKLLVALASKSVPLPDINRPNVPAPLVRAPFRVTLPTPPMVNVELVAADTPL